MLDRITLRESVERALGRSRVVALLGPRQSGKTTLAREFVAADSPNYFDCEHPAALARLDEPMTALEPLRGLVVIDEVQLRPDLFPLLRVLSDREAQPALFMILGSASPDLVKGTSQSLAGRMETIEITPFGLREVGTKSLVSHWLRGGYPLSFLAKDDETSFAWRESFIQQYLLKDIPQFGIAVSTANLRRFWSMVAHYHGQIWNAAEIGSALGVSGHTARHYLDILSETFMVRQLPAWFENLGKRQVKSPKIFFRDSGIFHSVLGVRDEAALRLHPKLGASWEGYATEEILRAFRPDEAYFWKIHAGAELDLLCFKNGQRVGFQIKYGDAPKLTASMHSALEMLGLQKLDVIYPGSASYSLGHEIQVWPLDQWLATIEQP